VFHHQRTRFPQHLDKLQSGENVMAIALRFFDQLLVPLDAFVGEPDVLLCPG